MTIILGAHGPANIALLEAALGMTQVNSAGKAATPDDDHDGCTLWLTDQDAAALQERLTYAYVTTIEAIGGTVNLPGLKSGASGPRSSSFVGMGCAGSPPGSGAPHRPSRGVSTTPSHQSRPSVLPAWYDGASPSQPGACTDGARDHALIMLPPGLLEPRFRA